MELKNQPIYKGVHKTLCINFRAYAAFFEFLRLCIPLIAVSVNKDTVHKVAPEKNSTRLV